MNKFIYILMVGITLSACNVSKQETTTSKLTMVVGTYTDGESKSKGIYTYCFDQETGTSSLLNEVAIPNPSYLTIAKDNRFIYSVSELNDGNEAIYSFTFDKEKGRLKFANKQPAMGGAPCYITNNDNYVVVANYAGGTVAVFPITKEGSLDAASQAFAYDGSGPDQTRQASSHLHCVSFTPDGKFLYATDLGADFIYIFHVNNEIGAPKLLEKATPPDYHVGAGAGPRHITFSANGKFMYLLNELDGGLSVFRQEEALLTEIQTTQADHLEARGSADIHISPDGKFLYASLRLQNDGLVIYSIDQASGMLTKIGYQNTGKHPRNFCITPNGKYLLVACRDTNTIEVYERNLATGMLTKTNKPILLDKPVCIKFAWEE
nr:lactonase family protein [Bacteroides sp. 214]